MNENNISKENVECDCNTNTVVGEVVSCRNDQSYIVDASKRSSNKKGIASLVLGGVSTLLLLIYFFISESSIVFLAISFVLGSLGIVLGILQLVGRKKTGGSRAIPIVGIVLSVNIMLFILVMGIILFVVILIMMLVALLSGGFI